MIRHDISRRAFVATFAMWGALPWPANAFDAAQAETLTRRLMGELLDINGSDIDEAEIIAVSRSILSRYADMTLLAQTILGNPWRSASPAQRQAFTEALQDHLARKYGKQFRQIADTSRGTVTLQEIRSVRDFFVVTVTTQGNKPSEIVFFTSDRSGEPKFFNIMINGISLRGLEAAEIGALLDQNRGDIDGLIADMRTL